jgi:hypothetical protein
VFGRTAAKATRALRSARKHPCVRRRPRRDPPAGHQHAARRPCGIAVPTTSSQPHTCTWVPAGPLVPQRAASSVALCDRGLARSTSHGSDRRSSSPTAAGPGGQPDAEPEALREVHAGSPQLHRDRAGEARRPPAQAPAQPPAGAAESAGVATSEVAACASPPLTCRNVVVGSVVGPDRGASPAPRSGPTPSSGHRGRRAGRRGRSAGRCGARVAGAAERRSRARVGFRNSRERAIQPGSEGVQRSDGVQRQVGRVHMNVFERARRQQASGPAVVSSVLLAWRSPLGLGFRVVVPALPSVGPCGPPSRPLRAAARPAFGRVLTASRPSQHLG